MKSFALSLMFVLVASIACAQEAPETPPHEPLAKIGCFYFHAPQGCITDGEFKNSPAADLKVLSIRVIDGDTYLRARANKECIVFLSEGSTLKSDKTTKLHVLSGHAIATLVKGETLSVRMTGEYEYFEYSGLPIEDAAEAEGADHNNAPLFQPLTPGAAPSAVRPFLPTPQPRFVPEPQDTPAEEAPKPAKPKNRDKIAGGARKAS